MEIKDLSRSSIIYIVAILQPVMRMQVFPSTLRMRQIK